MTIEQIKAIANNPNKRFTKELKQQLTDEATLYGISVPNCACRNKWDDLLQTLYHAKKKEAGQTTVAAKTSQNKAISGGFMAKYKHATGVKFNGVIYDKFTPIETIYKLYKRNPKIFYMLFELVEKGIEKVIEKITEKKTDNEDNKQD